MLQEKDRASQQGGYQFHFRWIIYMPIMILLGIIPLIVRLVKVDIVEQEALYTLGNNIDFYSQAKSTLIMITVGAILFITFLGFNKKYIKWDKVSKIYYISIIVFSGMTIVSSLLSQYPHTAKWGMIDRAEGMFMILCYMVILIYTFSVMNKTSDYKYILIPLVFLIGISTVLGYFQYKGEDLLMTEWGKNIIIPDYYAEDRELLTNIYDGKNVSATMYHYNYMGSFTAMMVPMFVILTCFLKDYKWKIICGIASICSVFLLLASTARSGIIGLACSVLVAIILFAKYFLKKWKITLGIIVVGIALVVGANVATDGAILSRIPSLVQDMVGLITPAKDEFDYKDTLPIRGIRHEDGRAILELQDNELHIRIEDDRLYFKDAQGEEVIYVTLDFGQGNIEYFTQDERFEKFKFYLKSQEEKPYAMLDYNGTYVASFSAQEEVHLLDHMSKEPIELVDAESIGFKGKEKIGSARGYIWSRSLPMLKDTWLIGYGPDTYPYEFPQNDLLAKWYAYGIPNMTVDKPHNLYLQIAIQQGGIALIAFLILIGAYLVQCFKLYAFKKSYEEQHIVGMGLMLAVVGYLGAGMFNDSVVSVAPIFWILLGAGMAMNYLIRRQQVAEAKKQPHAVISINNKKHI